MSSIKEHLQTIEDLYARIRRLSYILRHDTFALVYDAAEEESRNEADDYICEIDPDSLRMWYKEQRYKIWEGWTLKEIRELASDERIRNCRNKTRQELIEEIGLGPIEAKEKARRKDQSRNQKAP
jgi:hypothetical protein